jgi:hypothetical protein
MIHLPAISCSGLALPPPILLIAETHDYSTPALRELPLEVNPISIRPIIVKIELLPDVSFWPIALCRIAKNHTR